MASVSTFVSPMPSKLTTGCAADAPGPAAPCHLAQRPCRFDLSRLLVPTTIDRGTTDECLLSHCCGIVAGTQSSTLILVLDVNQTRWCEASLNLTLCDGPRASSDRCVEFWNASNSQGCVVCICTVFCLPC